MQHRTALLVFCCIVDLFASVGGYTSCTDPALNTQGYTFTIDIDTNERVWSHCKFPNPKFDASRCGITNSLDQHYVCDPDRLITPQILDVDTALKSIQSNTSTQCTGSDGVEQSYIVAMVLINRIRTPDLSDNNLCINDCGELHPAINASVNTPTSAQKESIMANFADHIRSGWGLGYCENDVIVFYCQEFDMLYVSVGEGAKSLVTDSVVSSIKSTFASYKANGKIAEGLLAISEKLRITLRHVTPAHIVMIVNVIAVLLFSIFLFVFFHLRDLEYNVWGRDGVWLYVEKLAHVLSGAWMFNGLFYIVIMISVRTPFWGLGLTAVAGLVTVILYIFEEQIFPEQFDTGTFNFTM